jgi:hypothetical protein
MMHYDRRMVDVSGNKYIPIIADTKKQGEQYAKEYFIMEKIKVFSTTNSIRGMNFGGKSVIVLTKDIAKWNVLLPALDGATISVNFYEGT